MQYLVVGDHRVAIANLDEIIEGAAGDGAGRDEEVRGRLLRLAKAHNYIPAAAEKAYEEALHLEYLRRRGV